MSAEPNEDWQGEAGEQIAEWVDARCDDGETRLADPLRFRSIIQAAYLKRGGPGARRQNAAVAEVLRERRRQDEKWGEQNHDAATWLVILMEEVGEAAEAILEREHGDVTRERIREEMAQVAAVAVAILEAHARESERTGSSKESERTE